MCRLRGAFLQSLFLEPEKVTPELLLPSFFQLAVADWPKDERLLFCIHCYRFLEK